MSQEFFFDKSNPDCRVPEVPKPPVDFVPDCFIEPPPPPIFECIIPVPPDDPPPVFCPEFETEADLEVFYYDEDDPESCETRRPGIRLSIDKTAEDPCTFDVKLEVEVGVPRPPCPKVTSEHKTNVGYADCINCETVGSVGSAEEVSGLTGGSFPIPPMPPGSDENDEKNRPIFVAVENVVTQVLYTGAEFVPYLRERPVTSVDDLLAAGENGAATGTLPDLQPLFKFTNGRWLPTSAPVEDFTVESFAALLTLSPEDAPVGTLVRVREHRSLYQRQSVGPAISAGWVVVNFNPLEPRDPDTDKLLTLNQLLKKPALGVEGSVVRVRFEGTTFTVVNGQIEEFEKREPNDWVFEEADLPAYLEKRRGSGKPLQAGDIIGIAFPTDRYELTPVISGGEGQPEPDRRTWKPSRCPQNKFVFVTKKRDCNESCELVLFTEITVPIPRTPCPEFNIRKFEINTYVFREQSQSGGKDDEGQSCGVPPTLVVEPRDPDPTCETPGKCAFDIDLVIDIPVPETPCPEIKNKGLEVNVVFISDEPELDEETCCPLPENIIEVDDYDELLALTRRQADVGSFARQMDTDPPTLWERIGPTYYEDLNGDDDWDNIDVGSPEIEPGVPSDWVIAELCGSRLTVKTIKRREGCAKQDKCEFEVDLRINVPVRRPPCPEIVSSPPVVNIGSEDSPCVSCVSDMRVNTVEEMYAIPRDARNYGMHVEIRLVPDAYAFGEEGELIPISYADADSDYEFEHWDEVPGNGNIVPPPVDDDGQPIQPVPPWEQDPDNPPPIQDGSVITINSPPKYSIAVESVQRYGVLKHRWLPIENNFSPDRTQTFSTERERDQHFATRPAVDFGGLPVVANVTNPATKYIYVATPLDGPNGFEGPTGWVALGSGGGGEGGSSVDRPEDAANLPPEDREQGDVVNIENPVNRYKLEDDMVTWTPAPCPQNKFGLSVTREPPKDCKDPGKCTLALDFEINIPIPKTPCPQINVRDFSVDVYDSSEESCDTTEREECDTTPTVSVSRFADLAQLDDIEDGTIAQVGQPNTSGSLYRYSAAEGRWLGFVPDDQERKRCCGFSITSRNISNSVNRTLDTLPELQALRVPEDVQPGSIAVVLEPPPPEDPEQEDPGPWFFRAGFPPEEAWSRIPSFDPCNPPPAECTFDVDLNICIPVPSPPCPTAKSKQKTHVGYDDDECVTCKVDATRNNLEAALFYRPEEPEEEEGSGAGTCGGGCEQFPPADTSGGEPEEGTVAYYIGVEVVTSQFIYQNGQFAPHFQERTFDSLAEAAAAGAGVPFSVENQTPFFQLVDGEWEPVSRPTLDANVDAEADLDGLPADQFPPGANVGISGPDGGVFERQPDGSWEPVPAFNPTPRDDLSLPDLLNNPTAGSGFSEGDIVQIPLADYYQYDADGNLSEATKEPPNDWVFEEADLSEFLAERAADGNPVQPNEIIGVAFPTDRYRVNVHTDDNGDETTSYTPARCKKNKTVIVTSKKCDAGTKKCELRIFIEVTVAIPRPPCPQFSGKVNARGFYVNDDDEACTECGSDLRFDSMEELTREGDAPIGNGVPQRGACEQDIEPGTTAYLAANPETGEPATRWRWEPDRGGWIAAPCNESLLTFKAVESPDLSAAITQPTLAALCNTDVPEGTVYFIEETREYYQIDSNKKWGGVGGENGCTENKPCKFEADLEINVPIPKPPCPVFNSRKTDIKVCDDFPRASVDINQRESRCESCAEDDEFCDEKQCIFDVDFNLELPCPRFSGIGASLDVDPSANAGGSINFTKRCHTEPPKIVCGDGEEHEDIIARDEAVLARLRDDPHSVELGTEFKTRQPLPFGANWKLIGIADGVLQWERVICDPEPQNICEFDVDLSLSIPACEKVEIAEDDDEGTHTGIPKADRFKHYYLKAGDDCPPDPNAVCFNEDDDGDIQVANDQEMEQLLGKPPGKLRDIRDATRRQLRAGDIFKLPTELDEDGNQMFAWVRLDSNPVPSKQLKVTPLLESEVPKNGAGGRVGVLLTNYGINAFEGLQEHLGEPPDPRLKDGVLIKVGQGANAAFKFFKNGAFNAAKKCGEGLLNFVIVKEALLVNNKPVFEANGEKKRVECKFRYAAQIQICERMPDHNAPCTKYHGDACCDTGCSQCVPDNPCCDDEDKKPDDGNDSSSSASQGDGQQQPFRASPFSFPTLHNTTGDATGPNEDTPKDPCKDYVDSLSEGCEGGGDLDDPGYRPFKSLELNIKENFPEDRLSPPKITYQLDVAPNCLHGGKVRISKGTRPPADQTGSFSALPTNTENAISAVAADLPVMFNTGGSGGPTTCVDSVVDADAIGEGTIEIVNNRINLCLKLYTDECEEDTDPPGGPSTPTEPPTSESTAEFRAADHNFVVGPRPVRKPQAEQRLTAALLEDLISAINTHPELKEAIRGIVNQPD